MASKAPNSRTRDEARANHLIEAIGRSAMVHAAGRATLVSQTGLDERTIEAVGAAIERVLSSVERWIAHQAIALRQPKPALEIGLFADRANYEDYLVREGMAGLSGSLGMTHPVRCVSAVVADASAGAAPALVAAHESIHLWVLRSGLCPAWHAWPRWLHEGFAQLWDHRAKEARTTSETLESKDLATIEPIAVNQERLNDWLRIAKSTDPERFQRRDMIADRRRHGADYATSWALTHTLAHWGPGTILAELLHELQLQAMQPYDGREPEIHCLEWLKTRLGGDWGKFVAAMADVDRFRVDPGTKLAG